MSRRHPWKHVIGELVARLPDEFALADLLRYERDLALQYPNNRFIAAKIRQSLQILRDQGAIEFLGRGRYRRLNVEPVFSPHVDFSITSELLSNSQVARVALETWAAYNLYCLSCKNDALDKLPENTPVADFECIVCERRYQLKAKNGRFGAKISGAAYGPTIDAATRGALPEHILVEYDTRFQTVVFVDAIAGRLITPDRVIPRNRLSEKARRAGWQGCSLYIEGLPSVRIVEPAGIDRLGVRERWTALNG